MIRGATYLVALATPEFLPLQTDCNFRRHSFALLPLIYHHECGFRQHRLRAFENSDRNYSTEQANRPPTQPFLPSLHRAAGIHRSVMSQRQQQQQSAPAPSQTQTEPATKAPEPEASTSAPRVLRLRGANQSNGRAVQWAEDVVDNEGLGRKSSKGERRLLPCSPPALF